MDFSRTVESAKVKATMEALKNNGISAELAKDADEAKEKVLTLIPEEAEVMTMTSITLEQTGIKDALNSGRYDSVRNKLESMDRETQNAEMQKLGAAPEWVVGSVHAVTEDGRVFIASNTGSQLPAYVYGAENVVWVVGTQKIVKDEDEAKKRIYEYLVPLESERAREAYNLPNFNTNVSKLLIINKEINEDRIKLIFVDETLGF